jgi:hypothetical protein
MLSPAISDLDHEIGNKKADLCNCAATLIQTFYFTAMVFNLFYLNDIVEEIHKGRAGHPMDRITSFSER